jgi:pyruvyltransferase
MQLVAQGVECPEVYGDPALLLPRFLPTPHAPRYDVGVVPHYIDKRSAWLEKIAHDPRVRILDIEAGVSEFVEEVNSCAVILSSSLHGLICADAYRIPTVWIALSDEIIGGEFKFRDYRLSTGDARMEVIRVERETSLGKIVAAASLSPLNIDLTKLLLACPFLSAEIRHKVLETA